MNQKAPSCLGNCNFIPQPSCFVVISAAAAFTLLFGFVIKVFSLSLCFAEILLGRRRIAPTFVENSYVTWIKFLFLQRGLCFWGKRQTIFDPARRQRTIKKQPLNVSLICAFLLPRRKVSGNIAWRECCKTLEMSGLFESRDYYVKTSQLAPGNPTNPEPYYTYTIRFASGKSKIRNSNRLPWDEWIYYWH